MCKIGDTVWKSGGAWDREEPIKVTTENIDRIKHFWGSLYFDNAKDAERETDRAHGAYGSWQNY